MVAIVCTLDWTHQILYKSLDISRYDIVFLSLSCWQYLLIVHLNVYWVEFEVKLSMQNNDCVSNYREDVVSSSLVLCTLCWQCLLIFHSWLPLRYSLTFIELNLKWNFLCKIVTVSQMCLKLQCIFYVIF